VVVFQQDDRGFHEWLDAHPDGYFVNVKKSGFDTFETDLQIRRGRTLSFDVNLVK
jgi:hypothetical protein